MQMSANARPALRALLIVLVATSFGLRGDTCSSNHEPQGRQLFASPQANPVALSPDGSTLYVAATTSNTLAVIDTGSLNLVSLVPVGLEPVGVAVRPDGKEVWVSNHVSDSVSVVDTDPASATLHEVIATVQSVGADGVTQFDEPVGIAFASNAKAYVALSSRNQVAIVDVATRQVTGSLALRAQEPRALAVRNGLLYVASFESGNQTELSACAGIFGSGGVGDQCSLGLIDVANFAQDPNLPGTVKNIVLDPQLPDRDLFVFDTVSDSEVDVASGVGTLLYGLAVDSSGRAFVTETDARNDVNGDHGMALVDLDNRIFLNEVAAVTCNAGGCGGVSHFALEPAPPAQPLRADALATPYGIAVSDDDGTLVATAAATSRVFTLDAGSGAVLDILDLGTGPDAGQQIPRGVALWSDPVSDAPLTAYVLNTLENTVSVVDVSNPAALVASAKVSLGNDPTPDPVRRGRIAFNTAFASDSATFACASCHPDGNTDQLLWRIGGACGPIGCDPGDEPRSTMPIRGLKNTLPLHWDGTLGDPFGGGNGEVGTGGNGGVDCSIADGDDHDCFLDLVLESLSGVMCDQAGNCPAGGNQLSAQEQDDMASFLDQVVYPPARSRRTDDVLSASAVAGFSDFFTDQGGVAGNPDTCADSDAGCHELPLGAATNSSTLGAFDVPTMRGMTDRFLQFSLGPTNPEEILVQANAGLNLGFIGLSADPLEASIAWDPNVGHREETTFGAAFLIFQPVYATRPLDMFQMFEEASTGFSGALGRQVALDVASTTGGSLAATQALLDDLELADQRGLVNLRLDGVRDVGSGFSPVLLSYRAPDDEYRNGNDNLALTRAQLVAEAQAGDLIATLTAALPRNFGDDDFRQPLLAPDGPGSGPTGDPGLPMDPGPGSAMTLQGIDVRDDAQILVDGVPAAGSIACSGGSFTPYCDSQLVVITLGATPAPDGLHVVQVQNPSGPLSNELPVCVGPAGGCQ